MQQRRSSQRIKRLGDLVIALAFLAFSLPLMAIVALAIKYESPGPVFEAQQCLGVNGRRFNLLRFRSAVHRPEHVRSLSARNNTRTGRFLQYTRISELPQLINVLRGEMTLLESGPARARLLD